MSAKETMLQLALLYDGDVKKILNAIQQRNYPKTEKEYKGNYITILDEEYPEVLKHSYMPPLVLFYEGDITLLKKDNKTKLAIGTSKEENETQEELSKRLFKDTDYTLILGGRSKVDEVIAQETDNPLIVILGTPLSMANQKLKRGRYLILSEYPEETNVQMENFPRRNVIIGGLCDKVLVLSCKKQSSTTILINIALSNGKEIMVVPTSPFVSEQIVNNDLIYDGAIPVWNKTKLCETIEFKY